MDAKMAMELKSKQICRFCLTTNRPLSNIYKANQQEVPLSMQIVSCVSIEVFPSDKMPATICELCSSLMDYWYRFKQMCKEADSTLRLVPTTKVWPDALDLPQFSADSPLQLVQQTEEGIEDIFSGSEMFTIQSKQSSSSSEETTTTIKEEEIVVVDDPIHVLNNLLVDPEEEEEEEMESIIVDQEEEEVDIPIVVTATKAKRAPKTNPKKPETAPVKVLNRMVSTTQEKAAEPALKRSRNGNVEILMDVQPDLVETDIFSCAHCDRTFPLKQLLEIHEKVHTRDRESACELCPKKFFTKYDLAKHMSIHTGERPFKCVVCNKAFSRSTLLHRHQKIHADVPRFECTDCDRFFFLHEELQKHADKHKRARPFSCSYCPKSFAFKQGLERHEMIHGDSQPHPCEYCTASFSTRHRLTRHLTAHAGNRPFPCKYCQKSYLMSHHLSRHMRSHAVKEAVAVFFTCYRCQAEYTSPEALVEHMAEEHRDEDEEQQQQCPLCQQRFETADECRQHIQMHMEAEQFACEFCDLIFVDEEQMMTHSQEDHADEQRLYDEDVAKNVKMERDAAAAEGGFEGEGGGRAVQLGKRVAEEREGEGEEGGEGKKVKVTEDIQKILKALPKTMTVARTAVVAPLAVVKGPKGVKTYGGASRMGVGKQGKGNK